MWSDCGKRVRTTNTETGDIDESTQRFNFPDTVELMKHVEEKHVKPIAWALGDGPPGGFSGMCSLNIKCHKLKYM
jgi:hypothetical protein